MTVSTDAIVSIKLSTGCVGSNASLHAFVTSSIYAYDIDWYEYMQLTGCMRGLAGVATETKQLRIERYDNCRLKLKSGSVWSHILYSPKAFQSTLQGIMLQRWDSHQHVCKLVSLRSFSGVPGVTWQLSQPWVLTSVTRNYGSLGHVLL